MDASTPVHFLCNIPGHLSIGLGLFIPVFFICLLICSLFPASGLTRMDWLYVFIGDLLMDAGLSGWGGW